MQFAFYVLRTVRRAAEGEPPRLEGGGPGTSKTLILIASTVRTLRLFHDEAHTAEDVASTGVDQN